MTPQSDQDLNAKILQLKQGGGSAALSSLTTFAWDTVYCFQEGATADEINGEVGQTIIKPGSRFTASGALAVFTKDGKVVKSLIIPELVFTPGRQPANVILAANKLLPPA